MIYKLDIDEIQHNFNFNKKSEKKFKLRHHHNDKLSLLPYNTTRADTNSIDFIGVSRDFSKLISGKNLKVGSDVDSICKLIIDKVEINEIEKESLKSILKEMFLKNGDLTVFHPIMFNYKVLQNNEKAKDSKVSKLLYSVLFDEKLKVKVDEIYENKPKNILLRLILDSLPETNDSNKEHKENYVNYLPFIKQIFTKDFEYMLKNEKFYVQELENVLKYYYFFYVSQLSLKLNKMFNADINKPAPLFFHLEGERVSKTRTSYSMGWETLLVEKIENLFSHSICLEFLNHNLMNDNKYTYIDLKDIVNDMNEEEQDMFTNDIDTLIKLYIGHIEDVDWELFNINYFPSDNKCLNKIYELFRAIDFQFLQSKIRIEMRKQYSEWFSEYCKRNFLKRHGPLGYTLNLTQDYLILITRLCIKDSEKIGVKTLFLEFEKRGIYFDRDSKEAIMKMFEKLNLLEKKSDSGDAQYVKAIL